MHLQWIGIWNWTRRYVLNKYVITVCVFGVILTFCGEQSIRSRIRRNAEIRQKEAELDSYRRRIRATKAQMDKMNASTENLEEFAREQYFMHADNEDVYIIVGE